jgi:hypothetical protein
MDRRALVPSLEADEGSSATQATTSRAIIVITTTPMSRQFGLSRKSFAPAMKIGLRSEIRRAAPHSFSRIFSDRTRDGKTP